MSAGVSGAPVSADDAKRAVDFLTLIESLKKTKRTGWVRKGVAGPESIADHMYRMSIMALVAGSAAPGLDQARCVKLAVVHDIAEAIVGDITPHDNVPKEEKQRLEAAAIAQMKATLGVAAWAAAGAEIEQLWNEYEAGASPEARLLKDLDKVEMILQAQEYESAQGQPLQEFFGSVQGKLTTPFGQAVAAEIEQRRPLLARVTAAAAGSSDVATAAAAATGPPAAE